MSSRRQRRPLRATDRTGCARDRRLTSDRPRSMVAHCPARGRICRRRAHPKRHRGRSSMRLGTTISGGALGALLLAAGPAGAQSASAKLVNRGRGGDRQRDDDQLAQGRADHRRGQTTCRPASTPSTSTQIGACEPPEFQSAGGHFDPTGEQHGWNNPQGPSRRRSAERPRRRGRHAVGRALQRLRSRSARAPPRCSTPTARRSSCTQSADDYSERSGRQRRRTDRLRGARQSACRPRIGAPAQEACAPPDGARPRSRRASPGTGLRWS